MSNIADDHIYQDGADAQSWVTMVHPKIEGEARATQEAFDLIYEPKGWAIQSADTEPSAAPVAEVQWPDDFGTYSREELVAFAMSMSLPDVEPKTGKQQAWDAIQAARPTTPQGV